MKKNLLLVSVGLLISGTVFCMDQTQKKAKTSSNSEPFPAWKWEVDRAVQQGDTKTFAALAEQNDIKDQTFVSSLPGLALIALGPKATRIAMATILLNRGANVDQTSAEPVAGSTTPLGWACVQDDKEFAQFLISRGAKVRRPDNVERHPLTLALKYHPNNSHLIKVVMKGAHQQSSLAQVIANAKEYFEQHPSKDKEDKKSIQEQLRALDTYKAEIENSHSTSSTREAQ